MSSFLVSTLAVLLAPEQASAVDRSKFKSCSQSGFCKRTRATQPGESSYKVLPDTMHLTSTSLETLVEDTSSGVKFKLTLRGQADNTFRLQINEAYPLKPRFEVPLVLVTDPEPAPLSVLAQDSTSVSLGLGTRSPGPCSPSTRSGWTSSLTTSSSSPPTAVG